MLKVCCSGFSRQPIEDAKPAPRGSRKRIRMQIKTDIVIIGSGFAGSLCALLLKKIGFQVALIDKGRHPRFSIGESSTPIGNMILRDLAERYGLPQLIPLARFGTWRDTYPHLLCGRKRGFSYFQHQPGKLFSTSADHANELLVAASSDPWRCDTHWLRADVDYFLIEEARKAGVSVFEEMHTQSISHSSPWHIDAATNATSLHIEASFLIDASGPAGILPQTLELEDHTNELKTCSRALFGHFTGIPLWKKNNDTSDHPFPPDDAALHHCLQDGWMWMLRFVDERVSAGFVLDANRHVSGLTLSPDTEWDQLLASYPTLAAMFSTSERLDPPGRLIKTGRLQRLWGMAAGPDWALLPHTAGFIDPLHSTGIAHSLSALERLVHGFSEHGISTKLNDALKDYSQAVIRELRLVDLLVAGCYYGFGRFDLLTAYTMLYFAAATTYEQRRLSSENPRPHRSFLCADDPHFYSIVECCYTKIAALTTSPCSREDIQRFSQNLEHDIEPYNTVGLFSPRIPNMYEYTAAD